MRVGIVVTFAGRRAGGPETYEHGLVRGLSTLQNGDQFHIFCPNEDAAHSFGPPHDGVSYQVLWPSTRWVSFATTLPLAIRKAQLDLVHATIVPPLFSPKPFVLTIHDVGMFEHPEYYSRARALRLQVLIRRGIRKARRLICSTAATQALLAERFRLPVERLPVIHLGVGDQFRPIPLGQARETLRDQYAIEGRYVLYIGKLIPNKNILCILEAFEQLRRHVGGGAKLVLAGRRSWALEGLDDAVARLGTDVLELGYVDAEHIPALYTAAEMVVYPSLYEGFGLPVIEAMACGTPVVISRIPALLEVAGDASLGVDPYSVESIADGMRQIWENGSLRTTLVERGLERARQFTWRRVAEETMRVYKEALE